MHPRAVHAAGRSRVNLTSAGYCGAHMNIRNLVGAAVAGLALSLPVAANDKDPFEKIESINPEVLFKGIIREDDVSLLFQHMRESMAAAARGEEPKESAALNRRAEQIQREIAVRGSVLVGVLLSAFESAAKQAVREGLGEFSSGTSAPRRAPPPQGSTLPQNFADPSPGTSVE